MQPEETPREAGETAEQVSELDDSVAFGNAATDFAATDDDDTGDIEIVVPPDFQSHTREQAEGAEPGAEGAGPSQYDDQSGGDGTVLAGDLDLEDDLDLDDDGNLGPDDDGNLGPDDDLDLDDNLDLDDDLDLDDGWDNDTDAETTNASAGPSESGDDQHVSDRDDESVETGSSEPIASMPDRAIDDWISNSHEDAHANWLDQAQKGTRSTIIAVVLIALLIAAVAIAFIVATRNSV